MGFFLISSFINEIIFSTPFKLVILLSAKFKYRRFVNCSKPSGTDSSKLLDKFNFTKLVKFLNDCRLTLDIEVSEIVNCFNNDHRVSREVDEEDEVAFIFPGTMTRIYSF